MSMPTAHRDSVARVNEGLGEYAKVGISLSEREAFWRNHQLWLKTAGYTLRSRYHPDWVPSWHTSKELSYSEDSFLPITTSLIDAVRELDGLRVMLKRVNVVQDSPTEVGIASLFLSEPLASNPKNHCVPVYEILQVPEDSEYVVLVMPFLLKLDWPPFTCLGEIVEFLQQILEGLHFMHQQNVAHCDVKTGNIMSDTLQLFQIPPHPLHVTKDYSGKGKSKLASNRMQKSVKHYLVDLGLSHHYPPEIPRLQVPGYGGNRTVPEFQNNTTEPCDPFAVDVYCMGDFMRSRLRKGQRSRPGIRGLEFLDDLIADMVKDDPKKRPGMDEVMGRFSRIVEDLSKWKLMSRASTVDEAPSERIIKSVRYWIGLS